MDGNVCSRNEGPKNLRGQPLIHENRPPDISFRLDIVEGWEGWEHPQVTLSISGSSSHRFVADRGFWNEADPRGASASDWRPSSSSSYPAANTAGMVSCPPASRFSTADTMPGSSKRLEIDVRPGALVPLVLQTRDAEAPAQTSGRAREDQVTRPSLISTGRWKCRPPGRTVFLPAESLIRGAELAGSWAVRFASASRTSQPKQTRPVGG